MSEDRRLRLLRLGGKTLQSADALPRERAHGVRDGRPGRREGVVLRQLDANHARRFGSAVAADEGAAESDGHLAEDLAAGALADRALDAVESLGDFDVALEHDEQGTLLALVHRVLACRELDIGGLADDAREFAPRQGGEQRNAGKIVDGQHARLLPCSGGS